MKGKGVLVGTGLQELLEAALQVELNEGALIGGDLAHHVEPILLRVVEVRVVRGALQIGTAAAEVSADQPSQEAVIILVLYAILENCVAVENMLFESRFNG